MAHSGPTLNANTAIKRNFNYNKASKMKTIDMQRIRETLPKHGTARLFKNIIHGKTVCYVECWIKNPSLSEMYPMSFEKDYDMILQWQREIVGDALSEFFTEQTGHEWRIYFKRVPLEFTNLNDDDLITYTGYTKEQLSHSGRYYAGCSVKTMRNNP